jgi:hypothetical protein
MELMECIQVTTGISPVLQLTDLPESGNQNQRWAFNLQSPKDGWREPNRQIDTHIGRMHCGRPMNTRRKQPIGRLG